ncbi:Transposase IS4 [Popillia japonica]|uniref:Transposase IS4 n=1 Tax=Popillia japonica TaxID=7064 RepID=A0AAW1KRZ7_POPJA
MCSYEKEKQRLLQLYDEVSTSDEDEEEDPYGDVDGEYGSDKDYVPDEDSSDSTSSIEQEPEHLVSASGLTSETENKETPKSEELWENTTAPIPDFSFDSSTCGIKVNIDLDSTPLQVFELFFTPNIFDYILRCTNHYGVIQTAASKTKSKSSRNASFRCITVDEMKQFLGLCLLQGQISTSNIRRFFSHKDIFYFHPIFNYIMSGRRFEQILRVICCSRPEAKRKDKVQPLIDLIISQCQATFAPSKELSLDESLLHFRGRLGFSIILKVKNLVMG